jgi:hypothetical protein
MKRVHKARSSIRMKIRNECGEEREGVNQLINRIKTEFVLISILTNLM